MTLHNYNSAYVIPALSVFCGQSHRARIMASAAPISCGRGDIETDRVSHRSKRAGIFTKAINRH
jgi:hypothetical protein